MAAYPYIFGAGPNAGGSGGGGSIAVAVSNATPSFGQSITITATPTGFTPTSYIFFAYNGSDITWIAEQAGAVVNWVVDDFGAIDIYAVATDGVVNGWGKAAITVPAVFVCDLITPQPVSGYSLRRLSAGYTGNAALVRRSSDGATAAIGFVGQDFDTAALLAHVGIGNGFTATLYDQFSINNATQGTAASQPTVVVSGTVQLLGGRPTLVFDGGDDDLTVSPAVTFVHAFTVAAKAGNVNFAQYLLGGTGQGLTFGGTLSGFNFVSVATAGGSLYSSVTDTLPHQISFKLGGAQTGRLRVDGFTQSTGTTSVNMTISRIGTRPDAPNIRFIGQFSETILYPAALTDGEEIIIENNQMTYYAI